jgi:hypothetical protein
MCRQHPTKGRWVEGEKEWSDVPEEMKKRKAVLEMQARTAESSVEEREG